MSENDADLWEKNLKLIEADQALPVRQLAYFTLSSLALNRGEYEQALTYLLPLWALAENHLGVAQYIACAYLALEKHETALMWTERVLRLSPEDKQAHYNRAVLLGRLGRYAEAISAFYSLLHESEKDEATHLNIAAYALKLGKTDLAKTHYQKLIDYYKNHPIAQYMLAALSGEQHFPSAPKEYIEALFDQYARDYESEMKNQLDYSVPKKMRQYFNEFFQTPKTDYRLCDLGCGTGLLAEAFLSVTAERYGVDLSQNMLAIANQKHLYKRLYCSDIESFFKSNTLLFDLVLAADVFVYIGDLSQIFSMIKQSLLRKGVFMFSIELGQKEPYLLQAQGRYQHSPFYIETLAYQNEFKILKAWDTILRKERGAGVMGSIYLMVNEK